MGQIKIGIVSLCLISLQQVFAQAEGPDFSRKGLFISQTTISPGYLFSEQLMSAYFHPSVEYFFENRVSIRTDGYYFFTTQGDTKPLRMNHNILLGASYHFNKEKSDFYFAWQPGISFAQLNDYTEQDSLITNPRLKIAPMFTFTTGYNYYFLKYLNFFVSVNYLHGTHIPDFGKARPLDEIRFSAGLGWNLQFEKKK